MCCAVRCLQGTSSNPINVSDDEDLSQLLSDPVVAASIDKVSGAFYKAHPEVRSIGLTLKSVCTSCY